MGITAVGDTAALRQVIDARVIDSAQVTYNMLNPSAGAALPPRYPAQDYGLLLDHTRAAGVGVIGIRVLAGGALSGSAERHPIASPPPAPIGSATSYDGDLERARRLMPLVEQGFAQNLAEAATRFAISHPAVGTILVGMATPEQFEQALAAVQTSGRGHDPGRHGDAGAVRAGARRRAKRAAAVGRARPADGFAAKIFRRGALILPALARGGARGVSASRGIRSCDANSMLIRLTAIKWQSGVRSPRPSSRAAGSNPSHERSCAA